MKNRQHKLNHAEQSGEQRVKCEEWRTEIWRLENGGQKMDRRGSRDDWDEDREWKLETTLHN